MTIYRGKISQTLHKMMQRRLQISFHYVRLQFVSEVLKVILHIWGLRSRGTEKRYLGSMIDSKLTYFGSEILRAKSNYLGS